MTEPHNGNLAVRCAGCGVHLQTENSELPGFIPEKALDREPVICQRCFRIKNYNESSSVTVDQDEFWRRLAKSGIRMHLSSISLICLTLMAVLSPVCNVL